MRAEPRQSVVVVMKQATIEQHEFPASDPVKREPMIMPECCYVETLFESCKPRENSPLSSSERNFSCASQKMTVSDENFNLATNRQFDFQRIFLSTFPEGSFHYQLVFPDELFQCCVEEGVKIRLPACSSDIGVIAWNTIKVERIGFAQREYQILEKHQRTFKYLFESDKFQFERLFWVNALAIHYVTEEKKMDAGISRCDCLNLPGDFPKRFCCSFGIPAARGSPEMKV